MSDEACEIAIEESIQTESRRLGFDLDDEQRRRLATYFALLERWGQRIRLTGSREAGELIRRHLADAFFLHRALCTLERASIELESAPTSPRPSRQLSFRADSVGEGMSHMGPENSLRHSQTRASSRRTPAHASRRQAQHCRPLSKPQNARQTTAVNDEKSRPYLDVGSGGGLPALPLLALQPERRLTLVEARRRKATFLRSALHELSISGCAVFDERLEQLVGREAFEPFYAAWSLATFTPAEWLGRAAPLVARSGTVFVFIAGEELDQALEHHELELCQKHHWELADGRKRQLLAFQRL